MTLFPSVNGHPENITVITNVLKFIHILFDKVNMFETRELFEYAKNVYVVT